MELQILTYSASSQFRAFVGGIFADMATVTEAASVRQLLDKCIHEPFDCIITDDAAPFVDGRMLARRIRECCRTDRTRPRIFVLSFEAEAQGTVALLEAGADECMSLPLDIARLRAKVIKLNRDNRQIV